MIKTILSSSKYLLTGPGPTMYVGNYGQGALRFNPNSQQVEANDGTNWIPIEVDQTITMNAEAERAIDWALERMQEEAKWEALASTSETMRNLLDDLRLAKEKVRMAHNLIKEHS